MEDKLVKINDKTVKLTNLDKVLWPKDGYTKADLINYYYEVAPYILPHLKNRLFTMCRFPHGIDGDFFYQKDCPEYADEWVKTFPIPSPNIKDKVTNYILCNNLETLIWIVNQACIETHPSLSIVPEVSMPDIAVFDLDPMPPSTFKDSLKVAVLVKEALNEFGIKGYPKTSGASGLHIYVPIEPKYPYEEVKKFAQYIFKMINKVFPSHTSMERLIKNREGKIYLDYLQNTPGKTMACQYSLRPVDGANVSMPLYWEEVAGENISPSDFNIKNALPRLKETGDLYADLLNKKQSIDKVLELASNKKPALV